MTTKNSKEYSLKKRREQTYLSYNLTAEGAIGDIFEHNMDTRSTTQVATHSKAKSKKKRKVKLNPVLLPYLMGLTAFAIDEYYGFEISGSLLFISVFLPLQMISFLIYLSPLKQ